MNYQKKDNWLLVNLLALSMVFASIAKIPFLSEFGELKVFISAAELISFFLLMAIIPDWKKAGTGFAVVVTFVIFRVIYGHLATGLTFDQSMVTSFQEARFGVMLIAMPLVYFFLIEASTKRLVQYVVAFLFFLLVLDSFVFWFFSGDEILILGNRTSYRFVCSVMSPLVVVMSIILREKQNRKYILFSLVASVVMLLHTILVTTSRLETLLVLGVVVFIVLARFYRARWVVYPLLFWGGLMIGISAFENDSDGVAGRDYGLAFQLLQQAIPFGYGVVSDTNAKTQMSLPQDFFFSDYGILHDPIRYGVIGITMSLFLLVFWTGFYRLAMRIRGMWLLSLCILVYLLAVPILDYSTLNGSFLLAFMFLVLKRKSCARCTDTIPQVR